MTLHHTATRPGKVLSFLRGELGLSSSLVKRLKWQNAFFLDGAPVHTDQKVLPGQEITVLLEEPNPDYPAEDGPLSILYEDEALLALDKPSGLLMHPSFHRNTGTLANFVAGYYARTGQSCAVHPVSRLDRDTFGVVLLAKNAHIHAALMASHRAGQLQKTYEALTWGVPDPPAGLWEAPIGRKPGQSLLREIRPDGKTAVTRYETLEVRRGAAHLRLWPLTGRTHQLRLHCAHAGCPILGDAQYGAAESQAVSACLGLSGQQLLACALTLPHPVTGERLTICSRQRLCPLPLGKNGDKLEFF